MPSTHCKAPSQIAWLVILASKVLLASVVSLPSTFSGCGRSTASSADPVSEPPPIATDGPNRDVAKLAKQLLADWNRPQVPLRTQRKWVANDRFSAIQHAVFSKDGSRIALYTGGETVVVDAATGQTVWKHPGQLEFAGCAVSLAISPDGRRVMMDIAQARVVETWDIATDTRVGHAERGVPVHFAGTSVKEDSIFALGLDAGSSQAANGQKASASKSFEIFWADGSAKPIPIELSGLFVVSMRPLDIDERYLLIDRYGGVHEGKRNEAQWTTEVVCDPPPDEVSWNNRQKVQHVAQGVAIDSNSTWLVAGRDKQWNILPLEQLNRAKEGLIELKEARKDGERWRVDLKSIAAGLSAGSRNVRDVRLSPDGKHALLVGSSLDVVALERPAFSIPIAPLGTEQESPQPVAISHDARFVATRLRLKDGVALSLNEVGAIPPSRGQRVEDWARKALETEDHELIEAVLNAAAEERANPTWLVTDVPPNEANPLKSALVHVLREDHVPVWARRYREKSDAWASRAGRPANADFVSKKKAAPPKPALVNGELPFHDNPEAQALVEGIIGTLSATPEQSARLLTLGRKGVIPRDIFVNAAHCLSKTASVDDPSVQALPAAMLETIVVDASVAPATFPVAFINMVVDRYEREFGPRSANRALAILCADLARRRQLAGYGGMKPSGAASIGQSVPEAIARRGDFDETRSGLVGMFTEEQELQQNAIERGGTPDPKELALFLQRRNNALRRTILREHFGYHRLADGLLQLLGEAPQGTDLKATSDEFYDAEVADHHDIALVAIRIGYDARDKELVRVAGEVIQRYAPVAPNPAIFPVYRYDVPSILEWAKAP